MHVVLPGSYDRRARPAVSAPSPLAGRGEAVRSVLNAVENNGGAVVVGGQGIGKTALVNHVAAAVGEHFYPVYIRGSAVSAKTDYGALGWLLSELPEEVLGNPVHVLRELKDYLRQLSSDKPVLMILDNAHELDPLSQTVTEQLARQGAVTLLATTPDLLLCGEGMVRLWSDGVLLRTDLGPLQTSEAQALMESVAGGRLSALAVRTVWAETLGNPLFTSLLCRDQIAAGRIQHREDTWALAGPLTYSGEISDWMENWYRSLPAQEQRIIELVSLCPGIPLDTLLSLGDPDAVDSLEERGLLRIVQSEAAVYVREKLYARLVARLIPVGRSFDLWQDILDSGPDLSRFPDSAALSFASWSAASGSPLDPALAARACAAANLSREPAAVLKISEAVAEYHQHPNVLLERGRALASMSRLSEAEEHFQSVVALGEPVTTVVGLLELALARRILPGRADVPAASIAAAETASAALPGQCRRAADHCIRVTKGVLAVLDGDQRAVPEGLQELWEDESAPAGFRFMAGAALAQASAMAGQNDAAAETAGAVSENLWSSDGLPDAQGGAIFNGALATYILCGDFARALGLISSASGYRYLDAHLESWAELPAGVVHALSGRADAALDFLLPARRQLEVSDPADLMPLAFAATAYSYAVKQDWDRMNEALAGAPGFMARPTAQVLSLTRYFRAAAALERKPERGGTEPLISQGTAAEQRGCFAEAVLCYGAAAIAGSLPAAGLLAAVAATGTGAAALMYQTLAAGLEAQNPSLLLDAAERAVALGNYGLGYKAAQASNSAASAAADRELARSSRALANECYRCLAEANSISRRVGILSEFERDLAFRAAGGESSVRLGKALHLSPRTIDWHLGRIFQKLHVSGRSELRRLLSGQQFSRRAGYQHPAVK